MINHNVAWLCMFALITLIVVYLMIMYYLYSKGLWIFTPYIAVVPNNACSPLIHVTPFTPADIAKKNAYLKTQHIK